MPLHGPFHYSVFFSFMLQRWSYNFRSQKYWKILLLPDRILLSGRRLPTLCSAVVVRSMAYSPAAKCSPWEVISQVDGTNRLQPNFWKLKVKEGWWAPGPVWTGGNSRPYRDSIPDRPARSQSLYRLSYPAHTFLCYAVYCTYILTHCQNFNRKTEVARSHKACLHHKDMSLVALNVGGT